MKVLYLAFSLSVLIGSVAAEEGTPAAPAAAQVSSGPLITGKERVPKKKGKRREQKETEGSEAPGRFEADTILKSPYTRDGQPLEVDPD